jgi:hypothetical protein
MIWIVPESNGIMEENKIDVMEKCGKQDKSSLQ